jgi:3-methyl-2-oxobutanoate hydroxymethyltransferase
MSAPPRGKLSLPELGEMKRRGQKIVMVTAYDAPGARFAEDSGVDLILVGDTAAMVVLGHEATTVPVTMDEMLFLTRTVARAAHRPIVVGDMPFGSYQVSDEDAVRNAIRFVKEAGADAVKLEGGGPSVSRARAIVGAGIPVMGHVGLTPQSATMLGGFKTQGRTAAKATQLVADAQELEAAGCFSIVLEAVPAAVAARITDVLAIPTIGIGAGRDCDGQVLVYHDLLGLSEGHLPRFVKRYANLSREIRDALEAYVADVRAGAFPEEQHTYAMPDEELAQFEALLVGPERGEELQGQEEQRGRQRADDERERRSVPSPTVHRLDAESKEGHGPHAEAELDGVEGFLPGAAVPSTGPERVLAVEK